MKISPEEKKIIEDFCRKMHVRYATAEDAYSTIRDTPGVPHGEVIWILNVLCLHALNTLTSLSKTVEDFCDLIKRQRSKDENNEGEEQMSITPPIANAVPDWAEWFSIDEDGWGDWSDVEPIPETRGRYWRSQGSERAGYFGPPEDWTKCRWQLEDGKWVQK